MSKSKRPTKDKADPRAAEERVREARKNYKKIHRKIEPFLKKREPQIESTRGQWAEGGPFPTTPVP
jgi:hypothetical protein